MTLYSFFHKTIFTLISFIYSLFFRYNYRNYRKIIANNLNLLGADPGENILDIGCGTGAFTLALQTAGLKVTGVDISPAMMRTAGRHGLNCVEADILSGLPFEDDSFSIVCAAYVAHGMKKRYRTQLLKEAKRVASKTVIIHDYNRHLPAMPVLIIEILETIIGGDFFGFRKSGLREMQSIFREVSEYQVSKSNSWYICRK